MDIAGAKALKERLGHKAAAATPQASAHVPQDAPPVYHYVGLSETPPEPPPGESAEPHRQPRSLFRGLRWISR